MSTLHSTPKANDLSKRRRFQAPITKFFSNSSESASASDPRVSYDNYSARTFSPTPTVPAPVQSSLLSVGMRVRKSVAEGYKTNGSKINEKTTFPSYNPTALHSYAGPHSELSPFGGALKVDSVTQAHSTPAHGMEYKPNKLVTDDGDAFSLPSSSQESATSYSTQPTVQKRSFDVDSADDLDWESDSSAMLMSNNGHSTAPTTAGRTILLPKLGQRRRFIAVQEQRIMDVDDFDEPAFLRRREEVDMDYVPGCDGGYEIRMGGA